MERPQINIYRMVLMPLWTRLRLLGPEITGHISSRKPRKILANGELTSSGRNWVSIPFPTPQLSGKRLTGRQLRKLPRPKVYPMSTKRFASFGTIGTGARGGTRHFSLQAVERSKHVLSILIGKRQPKCCCESTCRLLTQDMSRISMTPLSLPLRRTLTYQHIGRGCVMYSWVTRFPRAQNLQVVARLCFPTFYLCPSHSLPVPSLYQ